MPAAAGGPKGLALIPFDRCFARECLPAMPRVELLGASIGAWRVAALAQMGASGALSRLQHAYVHDRNSAAKPSAARVGDAIHAIARATIGQRPPVSTLDRPHDAFVLVRVAMNASNLEDALAASASIPIVNAPVGDIAGAPPGDYWDGGMIDYHLLPHTRHDGIVLCPHFVPHVTPGWLDTFLPWHRQPRAHPWLDNVLLLAPSRAFLYRLPYRKLPDREDFHRHGQDHRARIRDWERAIAECEGFAESAMRWLQRPDVAQVRPI